MLANVSFWLREQGEPLAEEVCGWLLAQETADVQKVRSGQSLEVARDLLQEREHRSGRLQKRKSENKIRKGGI